MTIEQLRQRTSARIKAEAVGGWKRQGGLYQIPPFRVDLATGKAGFVSPAEHHAPPAPLLGPRGFRLRSTSRRGREGYERLSESAEAFIYMMMGRLMARRLAYS